MKKIVNLAVVFTMLCGSVFAQSEPKMDLDALKEKIKVTPIWYELIDDVVEHVKKIPLTYFPNAEIEKMKKIQKNGEKVGYIVGMTVIGIPIGALISGTSNYRKEINQYETINSIIESQIEMNGDAPEEEITRGLLDAISNKLLPGVQYTQSELAEYAQKNKTKRIENAKENLEDYIKREIKQTFEMLSKIKPIKLPDCNCEDTLAAKLANYN